MRFWFFRLCPESRFARNNCESHFVRHTGHRFGSCFFLSPSVEAQASVSEFANELTRKPRGCAKTCGFLASRSLTVGDNPLNSFHISLCRASRIDAKQKPLGFWCWCPAYWQESTTYIRDRAPILKTFIYSFSLSCTIPDYCLIALAKQSICRCLARDMINKE